MKGIKLVITVMLLAALSIQAQGFVNLNFNSAQLSGYAAGSVPTTDALPGWTAYYGTSQQATVLYDNITTGEVNVSILDSNAPFGGGVISGNQYTVLLEASGGSAGFVSAAISQSAVIPATAQSILFAASYPYPGYTSGWQLTINGQVVPVTQISSGEYAYNEYAANVSTFAGQLDTLAFTALAGTAVLQPGDLSLAGISFSSNPIPEPCEFALVAIGAVLLGCCRWRKAPK